MHTNSQNIQRKGNRSITVYKIEEKEKRRRWSKTHDVVLSSNINKDPSRDGAATTDGDDGDTEQGSLRREKTKSEKKFCEKVKVNNTYFIHI